MSYSYVTYNSNSGVQRNARPLVITAVVMVIMALTYAVLSMINSGYIAQSPYSNISTRTVRSAVAEVPANQPPSGDDKNAPVVWPATIQTNTVAKTEPVAQPTSATDSAQTSSVTPMATEVIEPTLPPAVDPTPVVEPPVVTEPGIEVPCLCEVVDGVVDTVTGLVPIL